MKTTGKSFVSALRFLAQHPALFFPKILLSALFGIVMVATAQLSLAAAGIESAGTEERATLFVSTILLLAFLLLLMAFDALVNAAYSIIVQQFRAGKKIAFRTAIAQAIPRAKTIITATFITLVFFTLVTLPFELAFLAAVQSGSIQNTSILGVVFLALLFAFALGLYWLYPVTALENKNSLHSILSSMRLSLAHARKLFFASLFPFLVSLANFFLAFFAQKPEIFLLFIAMRILTAVVYTYHLILNPTLYLDSAAQSMP